jgi:hypothetical protein
MSVCKLIVGDAIAFRKVRRFRVFLDGAASWSRLKRIIARRPDTRFVVTNLEGHNPRALDEDVRRRR